MTASPSAETQITVDGDRFVRRLFLACVIIEILLVVADAVINYGRLTDLAMIRRLFNTTREDALASWFAVTQTWMVGLTMLAIYFVVRAQAGSRTRRIAWLVLSLFIMYMAIDDGSEIHERIGSATERLLGGDTPVLSWFPSYAWQVVFLPAFAAFGLGMVWFLNRELQSREDKLRVVAAVALFATAVVFDFFEGLDSGHPLDLHTWIRRSWRLTAYDVSHFSKSFEEFFEMVGTTLLWVVSLRHLMALAPSLQLRFVRDEGSPSP